MKRYLNNDTGEVFTEDELKVLWSQFGHEMKFNSYDDFTDSLEEVDVDKAEDKDAGDKMRKWYAVLSDADDTDWGTGSHSFSTAKWMLADAGYEDGRIAVINIEGDPVCEKILTREELGI